MEPGQRRFENGQKGDESSADNVDLKIHKKRIQVRRDSKQQAKTESGA